MRASQTTLAEFRRAPGGNQLGRRCAKRAGCHRRTRPSMRLKPMEGGGDTRIAGCRPIARSMGIGASRWGRCSRSSVGRRAVRPLKVRAAFRLSAKSAVSSTVIVVAEGSFARRGPLTRLFRSRDRGRPRLITAGERQVSVTEKKNTPGRLDWSSRSCWTVATAESICRNARVRAAMARRSPRVPDAASGQSSGVSARDAARRSSPGTAPHSTPC